MNDKHARSFHEITDESKWLAMRARDITSTEVSALFGLNPYETHLELWHRKKEQQVVKFEGNERMKWGTRLEAAIAEGVAEDRGWKIRKKNDYGRIPALRMGASFDYEVTEPESALLEVKNVDGLVFKRSWTPEGDDTAPPPHIELQLQQEMLVGNRVRNHCAALVGGNSPVVVTRDADPDVQAALVEQVAKFWQSIEANQPPAPDYLRDADFLARKLYGTADGTEMNADADLDALLREFAELKDQASAVDGAVTIAKSKILERIGSHSRVLAASGTLSAGMTKPSTGTLITADMVGTYIGARAGFRSLRFTRRKEK